MDAVGSSASVIAVIELSAKVASLCIRYSSAVKNARSDIERFQSELERLKTCLHGAQKLLESPSGVRLQTSQRLWDGLSDCSSQLTQVQLKLEKKLSHGSARKVMSQFGVRALKWPFESKEIDGIIKNLERYRDTLSLGLVVDQAYDFAPRRIRLLPAKRAIVLRFLMSPRHSSFPSCRSRTMQLSTLTRTSTTRNATPRPGSTS